MQFCAYKRMGTKCQNLHTTLAQNGDTAHYGKYLLTRTKKTVILIKNKIQKGNVGEIPCPFAFWSKRQTNILVRRFFYNYEKFSNKKTQFSVDNAFRHGNCLGRRFFVERHSFI